MLVFRVTTCDRRGSSASVLLHPISNAFETVSLGNTAFMAFFNLETGDSSTIMDNWTGLHVTLLGMRRITCSPKLTGSGLM